MSFSDLFRPKWKNSDPRVRAAAVRELNDQSLLAEVAKNDSASGVRCAAISNVTGWSLLMEVATSDSDREVRATAAERLAAVLDGVTDRAAIDALLWLLNEGAGYTRVRAAKSLAKLGDTRAVPTLIAILDKAVSAPEALSAAEALGEIGDQPAVKPLIEAFARFSEPKHLDRIANALGRLGVTGASLIGELPQHQQHKVYGYVCPNCGKLRGRILYKEDPSNVCLDCHRTIRAKLATHRGPWCHSCGSLYHSSDELPRDRASYDDQVFTTHCPKCGSEKVY